jgi:ABC-type Fe3+ transport system permease subunit
MNELEDIKLKAFLQNLELEKPGSGFTVQVMNKIFAEDSALEQIKSERILGKGFWIISILFVVLLAAIFVVSNTGMQADSQIGQLLPEAGQGLSEGYESFFSKLGTLPLSIAGITIGVSVLIFIDKIISSNSKIFA